MMHRAIKAERMVLANVIFPETLNTIKRAVAAYTAKTLANRAIAS